MSAPKNQGQNPLLDSAVPSLHNDPIDSVSARAVNYRLLTLLGLLAGLCTGFAQPNSPELNVPRDFEARLVSASLPAGASAFDFDASGRLWVAVPYVTTRFFRTSRVSRVLVYEIENGAAVRPTVFAEGLKQPISSFVCYKNGIIAAQAPNIVCLIGKPSGVLMERQQILFSGFAPSNATEVVNHLRWGTDGWIYASQSARNPAEQILNKTGRKFGPIGCGLFRFRPDGEEIEKIAWFGGKVTGLDVSWDGEIFFTQNKPPHLQHVMMEECYLQTGRFPKTTSTKAIEDHRSFFPAGSELIPTNQVLIGQRSTGVTGLAIYDGGAWPLKYNGCQFLAEPVLHLVHEDIVSSVAEGAGYEATRRQEAEFITAKEGFSPSQLQVGPDGALYILDARPGEESARLWRIQHHSASRAPFASLAEATPAEWVKKLEHPNKFVRMSAARLIMEQKPQEIAPALSNLLHTARLPYARMHAIWGLFQIGALAETNLLEAIADPHPAVQKNAFRIAMDFKIVSTNSTLEKAMGKLLTKDLDDRTRLRAVLAFRRDGLTKEGKAALVKASADYKDAWSRSAALGILHAKPMESLKTAFASEKADALKDFIGFLALDIATSEDKKTAAEIISLCGAKNPPSDGLKAAIVENFDKNLSANFIPEWSPELEKGLKALIGSQSHTIKYAALPLAVHWDRTNALAGKIQGLKKQFFGDLEDKKVNDEQRSKLITGLMKVPAWQKDLIPMLDKLLGSKLGEPIQKHLYSELANSRHKDATELLLKRFGKIPQEHRPGVVYALVIHPEQATALLEAVKKNRITLQDLGAHVLEGLIGYPDGTVAAAARVLYETEKKSAPSYSTVLADLEKPGDARKGKEFYQRNCGLCHKAGPEGKDLGPNLSYLALEAPEKWINQVLEHQNSPDETDRVYYVTARNNEVFFGTVLRETSDGILLRNWQEDREIRRSDIVKVIATTNTLMPNKLDILSGPVYRDIAAFIKSTARKGT